MNPGSVMTMYTRLIAAKMLEVNYTHIWQIIGRTYWRSKGFGSEKEHDCTVEDHVALPYLVVPLARLEFFRIYSVVVSPASLDLDRTFPLSTGGNGRRIHTFRRLIEFVV